MAKYSKRRSRRRVKRKGRGGSILGSLNSAVGNVGEAFKKTGRMGANFVSDVGKAGEDAAERIGTTASQGVGTVVSGAKDLGTGAIHGAESVGNKGTTAIGLSGGKSRGGSGRCCFPAKFCGSRKRKGNKRRSIRTGRCCLPVKSKKCGARKKNGRKTKKNKRKRGVFNMFGG